MQSYQAAATYADEELGELVDLYPTLVELANLPPKSGLDGESLVPLLKHPKAVRNAPAFTTFLEGNHAVATKNFRYIRYADGSEELYHADDLWNHENLAGDQPIAEELSSLRTICPEMGTPAAQR